MHDPPDSPRTTRVATHASSKGAASACAEARTRQGKGGRDDDRAAERRGRRSARRTWPRGGARPEPAVRSPQRAGRGRVMNDRRDGLSLEELGELEGEPLPYRT